MTTYQLTAANMVENYGVEEALRKATEFAKDSRHHDKFWQYVVVWINQIAEARNDSHV